MKLYAAAVAVSAALVVSGCSTNADTGALTGAVAGALVGQTVGRGSGRVAAAAAGAFIGGVIGHSIGQRLDDIDRRYARDAEFEALESARYDEPVRWRNPQSGRHGEVIPRRSYRRGRLECREYEHRIFIDGRPEVLIGEACRNPDGTWSAVG
ncbi:MAG: RT0821/Lpp0805 family surface protein [Hyphomicrobiaceae bacterium]